MKQRVGAILCMLLGAVLIFGGLSASGDSTVGTPTADCGATLNNNAVGTSTADCPTGTIAFTETTLGSPTSVPTSWTVTITSSNCMSVNGGVLSQTVTVPNGGSASSTALYIFTNNLGTTSCDYSYVETPVTGFTPAFTPASPQPIPFTTRGSSVLTVALTNTADVVVTSPAPVVSTTSVVSVPPVLSTSPVTSPVTTSSEPETTSAPVSSDPGSGGVLASSEAASSSSGADALATTGTATPLRPTLWIGIAVFLFGFVLLFAGRARRTNRQH